MTASVIQRTEHPAPAAVQPNHAIQSRQHRARFPLDQHHRQARRMFGASYILKPRQLDAKHLAVHKQDHRQGLIGRQRRTPNNE